MLDIISIGDPTIDTVLKVEDATVTCKLDHEDCKISFDFAEKIPVNSLDMKVAGNACNNAVGSSRLGLKTAYYMIVGQDGQGRTVAEKLIAEGVRSDFFKIDKKAPTNASTVINFQGERTILVYHAPRVYKLPKLPPARWAYYSSVNKKHARLNADIIRYTKKNKVKLCYNPGTFQRLAGLKPMQTVARACEIVFVNKGEARELTGSSSRHLTTLLKEIVALGAKKAVITDGPKGSYAYDGKKIFHMGILPTPVIERTGAGDSFATTFIAMLYYGKSIPDAMCLATANASSVIMKIGPQDGLLTKTQLERFHKKHAHQCAAPVNDR